MSPTNPKVGATPGCVENLGVMQNCSYSFWLKGLKSIYAKCVCCSVSNPEIIKIKLI